MDLTLTIVIIRLDLELSSATYVHVCGLRWLPCGLTTMLTLLLLVNSIYTSEIKM